MRDRHARGFTLLELMIVIAITGVLVAGIAVSIRDIARTSASRQLVTEIQGQGRSGLSRMQEELREASLGSRTGTIFANTPTGVQQRPALQIFDNVPGGVQWLDAKPGTDAVIVVSAAVRFVTATGQVVPVQASVNAANFDPVGVPLSVTEVAGFAPGQHVLVGPYKSAAWVDVQRVVGAPGNPGLLDLDAVTNVFPESKADVGSLVRVATARLYHVNLRDELVVRELTVPFAPQDPTQIREGELIAAGVENLQVDCELDGGGLGWFQGCPGVIAAGNIQTESVPSGLQNPRLDATAIGNLRTVVLTAVIRGRNPLPDHQGEPRIAVGNQAPLPPSGVDDPNAPFARRSYRALVGIRNTSLGTL